MLPEYRPHRSILSVGSPMQHAPISEPGILATYAGMWDLTEDIVRVGHEMKLLGIISKINVFSSFFFDI